MNLKRTLIGILENAKLFLLLVGVLSLFPSCHAILRPANSIPTERETANPPETKKELAVESAPVPEDPTRPSFSEIRQYCALTDEWSQMYDARHGDGASDVVLLTEDEIRMYNARLIDACPTLTDMTETPQPMTGEAVQHKILASSLPNGDFVDQNGNPWNAERQNHLLDNRAMDGIPLEVMPQSAVIVERCDMKGFPTKSGFYRRDSLLYDTIQETELIVGQPARILHRSRDGAFLFVQTYSYHGWIPASCAAIGSWENVSPFASPGQYITITEAVITVDGIRLDMGVRLPYLEEDAGTFTVLLPKRNPDGSLASTKLSLDRSHAVFGSLPYTWKNYYEQAFRLLGTPYRWGGAEGGIDCSGFVNAVFRTFGMYLPRNTGELSRYSGEIHSLTGKTQEDAMSLLSSARFPVSLYRPGHVMLYLGMRDSVPIIIHAPMAGAEVSIVPLTLSTITEIALMH